MIKIVICDDELNWINTLTESIHSVANFDYYLHSFTSCNEILKYLSTNSADIIFMDIQMPDTNGIDLAKQIHKLYNNTQIIFTSVSKDYIQEVFSAKPIFYLTKPFDDEKVSEALDLAVEALNLHKQSINIISKGKSINVIVNKIEYIESDRRTVNFHYLDNTTMQCLMKLDDVEAMLPNNFIRCHQSYLVNINQISRISNNEIELYSGFIIPVAKSRFPQTKKTILKYWETEL